MVLSTLRLWSTLGRVLNRFILETFPAGAAKQHPDPKDSLTTITSGFCCGEVHLSDPC